MLPLLPRCSMRRALMVVVLMLFVTLPEHIGAKKSTAVETASQQIDSLLSAGTQPDLPGLAALVKKDGTIVFEKGYGVGELRTRAKIDAQTNFRLASFTKQFTAMAIMLLVRDGKLRYDETLPEVFPDFPPYGKTIAIRNLLNHTSGLPDYEDLMEAVEKVKGPVWSAEHQIQDDEVLALLKSERAGKFAPGTSWSYSNSGYVVLGLIVAKISGKSYGEFLQARIFAPLKMNQTVVYVKGKNQVANRAYGYTKEGSAFRETDQSSTSATLGDGGVYSNLDDLSKWDDALRDHTLLSAEEMKPALTPVRLADGSEPHWPSEVGGDNLAPGKPVSYGFGWFLDPYRGHTRMWHSGSTMGFRTVIQRFTDGSGLTVILLSNRTDLDLTQSSLQAADLFFANENH
jgi:CubicO group peptidase (beta-lactamase class C family)